MNNTTEESAIADVIAERDLRCPACRYNLRGVRSSTCPECGTDFVVDVQTRSSMRVIDGWWLAGVIGLIIALVFAMIITVPLLGSLRSSLMLPNDSPFSQMGVTSNPWSQCARLATLIAMLTMATGWLAVARTRMRRMRPWRLIMIGVLAAASPLLLIGVLNLLSRL